MVAESTTTTYTDTDLRGYIERYPLLDGLGYEPYVVSDTDATLLEVNEDWTPTYDLNAAAADVWAEKAAALATEFDFSAGSQSFQRSQAYEMCMKQSRHYRSRRSAAAVHLQTTPKPDEDDDLSN
jgi:hypothetical protein